MSEENIIQNGFSDLNLSKEVLKALDDVGYETPTPIQAQVIPEILSGKDVVGQAQTGTGKTAAFALPLLSKIDLKIKKPLTHIGARGLMLHAVPPKFNGWL